MVDTQASNNSLEVAKAFCICLITCLFAYLYLSPVLSTPTYDFPQFYFAAKLVASGKMASLHDTRAYLPLIREIQGANPGLALHSLYFNRPAFEAPLFLPLASFSFREASLVMVLSNVVLMILAIYLLPKWFPARSTLRPWLVSFMPFTFAIGMGQDTLLQILLVAAALRLAVDGKEGLAGVILSLALFKPQLLFLTPLAMICSRRWKMLGSFALSGICISWICFAMVGTAGLEQWLTLLGAPSTDVTPEGMSNLRALSLHYGFFLMPVGVAFLILSLAKIISQDNFRVQYCATLATAVLLSPHSYLQDYAVVGLLMVVSMPILLRYIFLLPWTYLIPKAVIQSYIVLLFVWILSVAFGPQLLGLWTRLRMRLLLARVTAALDRKRVLKLRNQEV